MKESVKNIFTKITTWTINILFWICMLVMGVVFLMVFGFSSFKIPSDSMEPTLITGDNILICKPIIGPRIFSLTDVLDNKQATVYRLPGLRKIRRNDVLVFNFPHPNDWQKIEMDARKYYIKRCVGLPGDTLSIQNGFFRVAGVDELLGNIAAQEQLSQRNPESIEQGVLNSFPYHSDLPWSIKSFGPLYIPRKGDNIPINPVNAILYRKLIEWEQGAVLHTEGNQVSLDNQPLQSYTFTKNYYFMAGDRTENSQDSRYWGFLPEDHIAGVAWIVWRSVNKYDDSFRWSRFLKKIN